MIWKRTTRIQVGDLRGIWADPIPFPWRHIGIVSGHNTFTTSEVPRTKSGPIKISPGEPTTATPSSTIRRWRISKFTRTSTTSESTTVMRRTKIVEVGSMVIIELPTTQRWTRTCTCPISWNGDKKSVKYPITNKLKLKKKKNQVQGPSVYEIQLSTTQ